MYERNMNEVFPDLTTILKIYMTFLISYEAEKKFSISHEKQFLLIILKEKLSFHPLYKRCFYKIDFI